jgi:hypothetical protein
MRDILEEMASWMSNLADMRRIKDVVIYNPMVPLGLLDDDADEEHILRLWGPDPVHPTDEAYEAIAVHLRDTIVSAMEEMKMKNAGMADSQAPPPPQRASKPIRRESWISGTEPMAKRQATTANTSWKHAQTRGQSGGRHWKRGFRSHRGGSGGRGGGGRGGGGRGGGGRGGGRGGGGGRGFGGRGGCWMRGGH